MEMREDDRDEFFRCGGHEVISSREQLKAEMATGNITEYMGRLIRIK